MMTTEEYLTLHREDIISDLCGLLAIPSIKDAPHENAPYGVQCARALDFCKELALKHHLAVTDYDHHCIKANVSSKRSGKQVLFVAHADIVPPDYPEECSFPPLSPTIVDDYIVGRGSVDNKGPLVAILYALAFFGECHVPLNNSFSLLIGSNEEAGMEDMAHYLACAEEPFLAVAVDDDFPVVNSEKGVIKFSVSAPCNPCIDEIYTVTRTQKSFPDCVRAGIQGTRTLAFSSVNQSNPIPRLATHLKALVGGLFSQTVQNELVEALSTPSLCSPLFGADIEGCPTFIPTDLRLLPNGTMNLSYKMTYPFGLNSKFCEEALLRLCREADFDLSITHSNPPYLFPADDPIVRCLTESYTAVTAKRGRPYTMEGVTYAGKFKRGLGFGAGLAEEKKPFPVGHGSSHGADEAQSISVLMQAISVYIHGIKELDKLFSQA